MILLTVFYMHVFYMLHFYFMILILEEICSILYSLKTPFYTCVRCIHILQVYLWYFMFAKGSFFQMFWKWNTFRCKNVTYSNHILYTTLNLPSLIFMAYVRLRNTERYLPSAQWKFTQYSHLKVWVPQNLQKLPLVPFCLGWIFYNSICPVFNSSVDQKVKIEWGRNFPCTVN